MYLAFFFSSVVQAVSFAFQTMLFFLDEPPRVRSPATSKLTMLQCSSANGLYHEPRLVLLVLLVFLAEQFVIVAGDGVDLL